MQGIQMTTHLKENKNQIATEIKTQWMNLTADWTKQRRKLVRWMIGEEKLSRLSIGERKSWEV